MAVFILVAADALHKVRVHEADLISRIQSLVLRDRVLHEIVLVDIELALKRDLSLAELRILEVVVRVEHLRLSLRIIIDDELKRMKDSHHARALHFQVLADAVLEHGRIRDGVGLRNTGELDEHLDRLRRVAAAAKACDADKTRIIPAVHNAVLNELLDVALARHDVVQIHFRELDLSRRVLPVRILNDPVVQRTVVLELKRAERVRDALDRVLDRMREIVHRVNAPLISCVLMGQMSDPVNDRITHIDVGRGHIDLRAEDLLTVGKFAVLHFREEREVLLDAAVSARILASRLRQCSAVFTDLICGEVRHIGKALLNKKNGLLVHGIKIVRCKQHRAVVLCAEPCDIALDRLDKFILFLCRICIIEAEMELSAVFLCDTVIQENRFRVADVKVAVRLRGKSGADFLVSSLRKILVNHFLNKIPRNRCSLLFLRGRGPTVRFSHCNLLLTLTPLNLSIRKRVWVDFLRGVCYDIA